MLLRPHEAGCAVGAKLASDFRIRSGGFYMHKTGYDNIYITDLVQVYSRAELRAKSDEIVESTECRIWSIALEFLWWRAIRNRF